jgi:hypothetical protein
MKAQEVLNNHPLSKEVIKEWFLQKMLKSFDEFQGDESFKEYMIKLGIDDSQIEKVIDSSPRMLLDLFDSNNIYISIMYGENSFRYTLNNKEVKSIKSHNTRVSVEKEAILQAFKVLEEQLTFKVIKNKQKSDKIKD